MILAHKIRLEPTEAQVAYFRRACGTARFTWNHALSEWERRYAAGEKPNAKALKVAFNAERRISMPWTYEVHRDCTSQPFADLDKAFQAFFDKRANHPRFKKLGKSKDAFYCSNDKLALNGKSVRIPVLGWVKMREALRFNGKVMSARVTRTADHWYIAVQVDVGELHKPRTADGTVGVDLGVKTLAVLSTGQVVVGPRALRRATQRVRRLSRAHSRKVKGSRNKAKSAMRLARCHEQVANARRDAAAAMGRDRQVNTRRRAGMAANAIADAEHKQRMGETIARVAHAIETGEADALKRLTSRAQADVLHNASRQAYYRAQRDANARRTYSEMPHDASDMRHDADADPGPDSLQHVRLPAHDADAMARLARMGITTQPKLRAAVEEWNKFRKDRKSIGGGSVDAGEAKRKIDESAFMRQNIPGFFPTPKRLAERVANEADIKPGMTVLEPSAGTGRLADAAKEAGGTVTTLERSHALAEHLRSKGHAVAGGDTLEHHGQYDRVVMNPPFENGQDMDHVRHAFDANLKPGGKLVAIVSEGPFFRQDAKATAFRDWLASVGGKSEKLPEGSFKESNTGVATRLVTVEKPAPVAGTGAHPKTPEVMASLSGRMTPTDAERAHAATLYAAVKRSKTDSGAVEQGTQKVAALKRSIEDITDKLMHTHDAHKRAQDAAGPTAGGRHHRASAELTSQRDRKIAEYRGELAFLDAARKGGTIAKGLFSPLTAAFEELTR